jgi:hypothetical protein
VLLANRSLSHAAAAFGQDPHRIKDRLLEALDLLVRHFDIATPRRAA